MPATHDLVPRLQPIKRLTTNQGRSHQIWSDWVGSARAKTPYPGGAWGACSPRKILKFRGSEIASETNFGPIRCQTTEFHMNAILSIASYTNVVGFPILFVYLLKATPFAGEARETNDSQLIKRLTTNKAAGSCHS